MTCGVPGCRSEAVYRTSVPEPDEPVSVLCVKHSEVAIDKGWPADQLVSLPKRRAVA